MNIKEKAKTAALKSAIAQGLNYLTKDPETNLPKLLDLADKMAGDKFQSQRAAIRKAWEDPNDPHHAEIVHIIKDVDPGVLKTVAMNFFVNSNLIGWPISEEYRKKYHCNIPWAILMDPTSACNLKCIGCWAAEYGHNLNLTYDELDSLINQGTEMGTYFYIYTGGEPLVRKKDIIKLCEAHPDCVFMAFTNGTLIDNQFADDMLRVKNFIPAISLEGDEAATDSRRGKGTYQKAMNAIKLMRDRRLIYGVSCCYTSANWDSITSDEYFDTLINLGVMFVWFFHYMPVGNDAAPELLPTPDQRTEVMKRIRKTRSSKPIFLMDFQNDAEYVGGCIAGGRRYLHINANGDADPCVFIHYSDSNIRDKSLLEILQSPLFMAYHDGQPFNENMLRPCPMLENPDKLREIIAKTNAPSTDPLSPESAEHLCSKTDQYAKNWAPRAEELWEGSKEKKEYEKRVEEKGWKEEKNA
ncbi:MAG: radical SAM protein [Oscillospiraceae bacterium]|jgi:MoaA/NifB/PqqE/SkfB family radical SAM enzyme